MNRSVNLALGRGAVTLSLLCGLLVTALGLAQAQEEVKEPAITIDQLAGPWQITLVGNTGCGASSMLFSGTLNASGVATGTLTGSSGGCGSSSSTQTFTINSLNTNGSGTASLSCGSGCAWSFAIQVAANKRTFNLVDVVDGGANVLAGTAVGQGASTVITKNSYGSCQSNCVIVPDLINDYLALAREEVRAVGLYLKPYGPGSDIVSQAPHAGTSVPVGSTVNVYLE